MLVSEYLQQEIASRLDGDSRRFNELWHMVPDFSARLRSFDLDSAWLHWSAKTFDGWYCVPSACGYSVYYQERGRREPPRHFESEIEAVWYAVDSAVLPLAT